MLERSYKTQLQHNPEGQRPHPPRTLNGGTQTRLAMPPEDGQPARRPRLLGGRRGRTTLAATVGRGLDDEAPARTGHDMGAGAEERLAARAQRGPPRGHAGYPPREHAWPGASPAWPGGGGGRRGQPTPRRRVDRLAAFGLRTLGPIAQGAFSQVVRARRAGAPREEGECGAQEVAVKTFMRNKVSKAAWLQNAMKNELEVLRHLQDSAHEGVANLLQVRRPPRARDAECRAASALRPSRPTRPAADAATAHPGPRE